LSSVVIGEGKIGLPDGFVMSERMRKVAAKRGLKVGSPGRKRWEKSEHANIVTMRSILARKYEVGEATIFRALQGPFEVAA
jgi:hypothetical protein